MDGDRRDRRSLRALAAQAELDRSDPEEQARLLRRAAGGDGEAVESLFNENLAMVLRAAEAGAHGQDLLTADELVQEGSASLLEAIRDFGGSGREDFRGFARERVQQAITLSVTEAERAAAAKAQLAADAEAYERAEISIRRLKGREATIGELAEKLEWPQSKTARLAALVGEARRAHDEDVLNYVDPSELAEFGEE